MSNSDGDVYCFGCQQCALSLPCFDTAFTRSASMTRYADRCCRYAEGADMAMPNCRSAEERKLGWALFDTPLMRGALRGFRRFSLPDIAMMPRDEWA